MTATSSLVVWLHQHSSFGPFVQCAEGAGGAIAFEQKEFSKDSVTTNDIPGIAVWLRYEKKTDSWVECTISELDSVRFESKVRPQDRPSLQS